MTNQQPERIENEVTAGEFHAIVCTWPSSNGEAMMDMSKRLNQNITNLGDTFLDSNGFIKEDLAGDFLYLRGKSWFTQVGLSKELASSFMHLPYFPDVGFADVSIQADVDYLFGVPYTMHLSGLMIDADRNTCLVLPKPGEGWKTKEFMTITGCASSALEHLIWEQKYGPGGISAVKAIQLANESGIPVYDITSANKNIIDTLSVFDTAKEDMRNAINAGYTIKTPASNITCNTWTGVGYIVSNPTTGEGRYEIDGGRGGFYFWPGSGMGDKWALIAGTRPYANTEIFGTLYGHVRYVAKQLPNYNVVYGLPENSSWLKKYIGIDFFNIFYFCGHGSGEYFPEDRSKKILAVELDDSLSCDDIASATEMDQYKIVFINACYSASNSYMMDAFKIEHDSIIDKKAFIGTDEFVPKYGAWEIAEKFWKYIREHPDVFIYKAADECLSPNFMLSYGNWLPSPGLEKYWQFKLEDL